MTALWVVVVVLVVLTVWLGLALAGAVRALAVVRARLDALEQDRQAEAAHLPGGLPVGAQAPGWSIRTPDGSTVGADAFAGTRHVLLFADADCAACDDLVPAVVGASSAGVLPPVAVIGRGGATRTPPAWLPAEPTGRAVVGAEHEGEVTDAFRVSVSPHLFVIDGGGHVVAQGGAANLEDVRALLRDGDGITIVAGAAHD